MIDSYFYNQRAQSLSEAPRSHVSTRLLNLAVPLVATQNTKIDIISTSDPMHQWDHSEHQDRHK